MHSFELNRPLALFWKILSLSTHRIKIVIPVLFLFLQLLPHAYGVPQESAIEWHMNHANTYYWFGMAEKGNMDSFQKGIWHLEKAQKKLEGWGLSDKLLKKYQGEISAMKVDFQEQSDVHSDTLYGVFPLVRLLAPSLFADALATGTFELVDDPAVMAATAAGFALRDQVLERWSSKPQLSAAFTSTPANKALENELLYVFNASGKFFLYNYRDITAALPPVLLLKFKA
jgi:hypothetical protein